MNHYDPTDPFAQGEIENRVKLGSELLDEHYTHWEEAISLEALNLEDSTMCPLGQIGGHSDFSGNKDFFGMVPLIFTNDGPLDQAVADHGFDIIGGSNYWVEEYAALTKAWVSAITERKSR